MVGSKGKIAAILLTVFVITFGTGALVGNLLNGGMDISPKVKSGKTIHILFMGIDARDAHSNSRSDTMILASIDAKDKKIALTSIPRDTRIKNSKGHYDKINSVNYIEGPEEACKVVSDLLGVPVKHYVVTNFAGFASIIDTLGGVDIDVEMNMYHPDAAHPELAINLSKGVHHLDGQDALNYVRYRGGPTADIGRTQRQQKFLKAIADEMLKTRTITKLPKLVPELAKNVHTNLSTKDMLSLAGLAKEFDSSAITAQTLPGYPWTDPYTGASYWLADKDKARDLVKGLLAGETFDVVGDPPEEARRRPTVKPTQVPQEVEPPVADPDALKPAEEQEGEITSPGETVPQQPSDPSSPPANETPGNTVPNPQPPVVPELPPESSAPGGIPQ